MDSDRIEGKAKEAEGTVTGDESLKREGELQGTMGEAEDKADDAWEATKDKADDAWDATKDKARELKDKVDDAI